MSPLFGFTEIAFAALPIGEDAPVMRGIIKRSRRRGRAANATVGTVSGLLSCVRHRLRCAGIAARRLPCQQTGYGVSVGPNKGDML